jgi:hypothetical protein
MPSVTLAPDGVASSNLIAEAGGSGAAIVTTNDGDGTYVAIPSTNANVEYTFGNLSIAAGSTINNVRIIVVTRRSGSSNVSLNYTLSYSGTATSFNTGNLSTSYATFTQDSTTTPQGAAWTIASVNGISTRLTVSASSTVRVTQVALEVTYTEPATADMKKSSMMAVTF